MDECGRGAFAGPLVAAGVIINHNIELFPSLLPAPLRDSKRLTAIQRNKIYAVRRQLPIKFVIEQISVEEINQMGMGWANKKIFEKITKRLKARIYITDGNLKFTNQSIKSLIKADAKSYQVMMASILAKAYRDNLLAKLHRQYKSYGWNKNAGYGSDYHRQAIKDFGITPQHRTGYINTWLKNETAKLG